MNLEPVVGWVRRRAENLVAALLGLMFLAFVVQIVFRYAFNFPVGWSTELSLIAWLYMVLLGSALWLKEDEEIRFDLLASTAGPRARRTVDAAVALATVVLFAAALPATWRYVSFMKVESSAYLKIRMDWLYSLYLVFAAAVVLRYAWKFWATLRGRPTGGEVDVAERGYGL